MVFVFDFCRHIVVTHRVQRLTGALNLNILAEEARKEPHEEAKVVVHAVNLDISTSRPSCPKFEIRNYESK